ncbi:MAG: hypothetical protein ACLSW9_08630, partial [Megasphaera micronuciformis]
NLTFLFIIISPVSKSIMPRAKVIEYQYSSGFARHSYSLYNEIKETMFVSSDSVCVVRNGVMTDE